MIIFSFQFVGHYDEILDLAFVGENDSMLSVASNSPAIKIIDIDTLDCRILTGHSGKDDYESGSHVQPKKLQKMGDILRSLPTMCPHTVRFIADAKR